MSLISGNGSSPEFSTSSIDTRIYGDPEIIRDVQQKSTSYTTFYTTRPTTWHCLMLVIPSITGQA